MRQDQATRCGVLPRLHMLAAGVLVSGTLGATVPTRLCAQDAVAAAATQRDAAATAQERADSLAAQMTASEQHGYIEGWFPPMVKNGPGDMVIMAGYVPGVPRLGIPTLRESDASLGVANNMEGRKGDTATALPASLALAASFSPELAYRSGAMIGAEARAKTFNVLLAGGVNLVRDAWGGRAFEYLGEDPLLAGVLGGESVRGVQSNRIVSTLKHLALNPQETLRHTSDALIGEAALRESDLLAFQIAIERGRPGAIMCAYVKVNGDWACENRWLLDTVLRRDWGYRGWVMSDWGAVHSAAKAINAGLDQESGRELDKQIYFAGALDADLGSGAVTQDRIEAMNRRILWGVVSTGLIDDPVPTTPRAIDTDAHATVAREVAEKGIVLLRNEGDVLPLARTAKRILMVGGHSDVGVLSGGGSSQVRSVGGMPVEVPITSGPAAGWVRRSWHASSPLAALRKALPGARISYLDGRDRAATLAAARQADVVIAFATQWRTEAEDVATLSLDGEQDALIGALADANAHTVVVLQTGGAVLMPWLDKVPAVIAAWYPGQRGGEAIAAVLTGTVNPSGHLPITFPASEAQLPRPAPVGLALVAATDAARRAAADPATIPDPAVAIRYPEGAAVGYRGFLRDGKQPLFPFGYGLSYTSFAYSDLAITGGETVQVSFTVTNTGRRAGADVAQAYVTAGSREMPYPRLIGFARVELDPRESRRVTLVADRRLLADYDTMSDAWHVAGGSYPVAVGHFAGDETLTGTALLTESRFGP